MPGRWRRLIRIALIALASPVTLIVLALLALQTPPAKRYVLARVRALLAAQGIDLQAGALDYNLFTLSLSLDRVVVRGGQLPEAPPIARIGHADLNLSLTDLLGGKYVIQSGTLVSPDIHVLIDEQGRTNLPQPASAEPTSASAARTGAIDYLIQHSTITDARLRYEDRRQQLDAFLPIASLAIAGERATRRHAIHVAGRDAGGAPSSDGGKITLQGRTLAIDRLAGDLTLDPDALAVKQLDLGVGGSTLTLAGNLVRFADPRYDLSLGAQLDVTRLATFAGVTEPVGGAVRADIQARGPMNALTVSTRLRGDDLRFRGLQQIDVTADAAYDASANQARVAHLTVTGPIGRVNGDALIGLAPQAGESQLNLGLDGIDVAAITRALAIPYGAATRVQGTLRARWPQLDYAKAVGDGKLTFTPTQSAPARGVTPLAGTLILAAREQGTDATVELQRVQALGATLDGRVSLANQKTLGGTLRAQAADLAGVIPAVEAFLGQPAGSLVGTPIAGPLSVDTTLQGTLDKPAVDATVDAPRLSIGTASDINLHAEASGTPAEVLLKRGDVAWHDARVRAQGRVGLAGDQPIDLIVSGERTSVTEVLKAIGQPESLASGTVSFQAAAQGTVKNPRATFSLDGHDLVAYEEPLGTLALDGGFADQRAELKSLRLDKPQPDGAGTLTGHGAYDLRTERVDLDLTSDNLRLATIKTADGKPVRAALDVKANLHGTVADPNGTATIAINELTVGEDAFGNVTLNAEAANQQARIRAAADRFKVSADARVATVTPYAAKADVTIDHLDFATLPLHLETPLTGTLRGQLTAAGELARPTDGTASATIDRLALTWNGQPIETDGPATLRYADERLTIERLAVRARDSLLSVRGMLPLGAITPAPAGGAPASTVSADASARATGSTGAASTVPPSTSPAAAPTEDGAIDFDAKLNLATLAEYAPKDLGVDAEGALALQGSLRGTLRRIDPTMTLTVANGRINAASLPQPLSDLGIRLVVEQGAANLADLQASWGAARLAASGHVPFGWLPAELPIEIPRQNGPAELHAAVTGLDLATLPGAPEKLTGMVSLKADVQAPTPDAATVTGKLTFPDLKLAFEGLTLAQQGESTIGIDRGDVRVERFALDGTAGHVELGGRVGLTGPQPLDVNARANLNLAALSTFTKAVRATGRTALELSATGTVPAPSLKGFATLTNGNIAVESPQVAIQGLNARVDFAPELITLAQLDGSLNGGTLSGSGNVALSGMTIKDVDLRLKATDIALDEPINLRSLSSADIHVTQRAAQNPPPPAAGLAAPPAVTQTAAAQPAAAPGRTAADGTPVAPEAPPTEIVVGGQVTIQEAGLTDDINLDAGIFQALTAPRSLDLTETRNPLLESVRFDLKVVTATPIIVDNNLARAEMDANLRLLGTPYETGLSGRLELAEGSELILNERRYDIKRGVITFIDDRAIQPSLDLELETSARKYDITITATGTPDDTTTSFTSTPTLPEPDIMALLVTGRTLDEMRGEEFDVAKSQAMSFLGGRLGSSLGRGLQRATGLSTVKVEPNLIASETDPGARLTVGQDLTDDLSLTYSTDLVNSSDNIWVAQYDISPQFTTNAVRQSDASYRFDFRHDVRFGGTPDPRRARRPRLRVASLNVLGQTILPEQEVRDRFKLRPGKRYDFFKSREGIGRVTDRYHDEDWLQARVRADRVVRGEQVDLTLRVNPGPKVTLAYEGHTPSKGLAKEARLIWSRGVFDTQRADDVADAIRTELIEQRYLGAKITYDLGAPAATAQPSSAQPESTQPESSQPESSQPESAQPASAQPASTPAGRRARDLTPKHVTFRVDPGVQYEKVTLVFEGAHGIHPDELADVIKEQKLGPQVFTDPDAVTSLLKRLYHERGYLAAELDEPRPELDANARVARVILPVREGPQFKIRSVTMAGNRVYPTATLLKEIPLVRGDPYYPATSEQAQTKLRQLYWAKGYNELRSTYALAVDREAGVLDVRFAIAEGRRTVVAGIDVQGTQATSQRLVHQELEVAEGQPLDLSALSRSRKHLYDTGAYALVDITRDDPAAPAPPSPEPPAPASDGGAASSSTSTGASTGMSASGASSTSPSASNGQAPVVTPPGAVAAPATSAPGVLVSMTPDGQIGAAGDQPVRVNVAVREVQPFQIRYGALFDTERGLGGILDISNHNSLGRARVVGLRSRYDSQLREARLYLSQPSLHALPVQTIASIYVRQERNPATSRADAFNVDRYGIMVQQEKKLWREYVWSYGYRFERARTYEADVAGPRPSLINVAPLTSTLTRETRDEVLDATTGSLFSQAFSYSPGWLGSDVPYVKYFGQYFRYFPLQAPKRKRFTNEIIRPRIVYAVGARLGLAHGFGSDDVPTSERFLAGGSTTMRGFAQNAVGPIGTDGVPLGGDAMLVINNELRFPLISIVDGVVFADIGNVFNRVSDFSLSDLRESGGVGLRLRTPWLLIRVDYGIPLDRRPGEASSRFFFSIGQAF